MTFRPSVLPDRDNDILSTFVRSFEQGRQLVRRDQADKRAETLFKQGQEDRRSDRAGKILDFNLKAASTPGLRSIDADQDPEMLRLAQALGGTEGPTLPGTRAQGGFVDPQQIAIPQDVLAEDTPVLERDAQTLGTGPGGRTVTFSQTLANRIQRENAVAGGELEEELGAPARGRDAAALQNRRDTITALIGAGLLTDADGNKVTLENLPPDFDPADIANIIGRQESGRQARATAQTPRAGTTPNRDPERVVRSDRFTDDLEREVGRRFDEAQKEFEDLSNPLNFQARAGRSAEELEGLTAPDRGEIEQAVLQDFRRTRPQDREFIDERGARGGSTPPPGGSPPPGGDGLSPDDLTFFRDQVDDIEDDAEKIRVLVGTGGLTQEQAQAVVGSGG